MSKKHVDTPADFDKGYEENDIGLKGIVYFGVGLFLLIVITFGLMWAFLGVMRDYAKETAGPPNPMILSDKERLPPEPRLQAAPGFGVDSEKGRINLELTGPQNEYWELKKQWDEQWEKGQVDPKTGTVISLSIDKAKEKYLEGTIKAKSGQRLRSFLRTHTSSIRTRVRDVWRRRRKGSTGMKKSSPISAVLMVKFFTLTLIFGCFVQVQAQKAEHYNSPLYAPKTYDPSQTTSNGLPEALQKIGIEQKLGDTLPMDVELKNEDGKTVKLGEYFTKGKPVIVAFVYYECPMLCNQVLNGLTVSLKGISLEAGKDFDVLAISFDARENDKADLAKNKKAGYVERYGRAGSENGWHFLTGSEDSIQKVTQAAGFSFKWDEKSNQFAHAGGLMITTPDGKLARYLYGIDFAPKDLKFGLMESAESKVGTPVDQLMLYCYHYDPSTGKYGLAILSIIRVAAVATLIGMGVMGFVFWRRNKRKAA